MKTATNLPIDESVLLLYLDGRLSRKDSARVEEWYSQSAENSQLLEQLYVLSALDKSIKAASKVDVEKALADFRSRIANKRKAVWRRLIRRTSLGVAAAAILISCGMWAVEAIKRVSEPIKIQTGIAERVEVTLPDGTAVWLNSCSGITYSSNLLSPLKNIDLEGEAFFHVSKEKEVHLHVHTNGVTTKVRGTQFNIRANSDESIITITLLEGSVEVSFEGDISREIKLVPGEQLVYNSSTRLASVTDRGPGSLNSIEWINGKLLFEQATFGEIARTLERNYNVDIHFLEEAVKQERFSCSFESTDNIYHILSILGLTYKFDYSIEGRKIEIAHRRLEK